MSGALAGIRVIDITNNQAGPSCGQLLAWFGADVIKVEEPGKGDPARQMHADRPDADSLFYLSFNANKRSLPLNLKNAGAKDVFRALLKTGDVLLENFGPVCRASGLRIRGGQAAQPAAGLREHQGLRHVRAVRRLQEPSRLRRRWRAMSVTGLRQSADLRVAVDRRFGTGMHCVVGDSRARCSGTPRAKGNGSRSRCRTPSST
jgi:hypothetical protein